MFWSVEHDLAPTTIKVKHEAQEVVGSRIDFTKCRPAASTACLYLNGPPIWRIAVNALLAYQANTEKIGGNCFAYIPYEFAVERERESGRDVVLPKPISRGYEILNDFWQFKFHFKLPP